ncbi:hypothetical protein DH2020_044836 [Rehmannia glutinosa]|uniref:Pseudouridine synthase RsuA/RluA-like domain-containing protein n=1 Tax=Rehmannia glutinosa TaxID=99300 RepID=A0ABR0UGK1_REHGL
MAERHFLRELFRQWRPNAAASSFRGVLTKGTYEQQYYYSATATNGENCEKEKNYNQWLILPPFTPTADGSSIGKELYGRPADTNTTALKWILKCCPHLPRCLVQKLFRLRQIRKECSNSESKEQRPRRVGAKDLMDIGDKIFLPKSVDGKSPSKTVENQSFSNEKEMKFIHSLELYKGGLGIKSSLDELAAKYLRYDYSESPRLVHRLDRDSSGILVMGRTQLSTTILHSIFREKTFGASNDVPGSDRILQKKYYALVIGSPRRREGLISVPLMKVVVDNGKSERITVVDNNHTLSVQHSATEYRVISSSPSVRLYELLSYLFTDIASRILCTPFSVKIGKISGYTWLELSPLTGRKHQLRVHCAEVLGTPIVGDYKYGWQAHKKLGQYFNSASDLKRDDKMTKFKHNIIGLELENGSISDKQPFLHLHCKEMILPNISLALQRGRIISNQMESIRLDAPLPAHMQRSWDLLN